MIEVKVTRDNEGETLRLLEYAPSPSHAARMASRLMLHSDTINVTVYDPLLCTEIFWFRDRTGTVVNTRDLA